jgi:cobalamin biosynthetic protein CobC
VTQGFTHHGGRLSDARARFGGEPADWLDLSTGINPRGWPLPEVPIDWRALPDPAALATLEAVAAAYFEVEPALCLAVPGSESALRGLAQLLHRPGRHATPSYSTHADAFAALDTPSSSGGDVLVIGNPNNPDGRLTPPPALLAALDRQERSDGWLLVDEAFVDGTPSLSVAGHVAADRRLIVTRSFGKFFGLAGVRLGFVIAPPALLVRLRHLQGEWPISAAAIAYGTRAYADAAWIAAARTDLVEASGTLDQVLRRHRLVPRGECALFRLVESDQAHRLFTALARRRILTRAFADHPRLLRFGLPGGADALARLDAALDTALAEALADG